jgi:drug/metabolite transporter (DMT)-like permease
MTSPSKYRFDGEALIMHSDHPAHVMAVLHSGHEVQIGGPSVSEPTVEKQWFSSRAQIVLGFAAIYLIWGSTYLGIRYAVETIPPLLMMGVRHFVAGTLVYAWVRRRGTPAPHLKQWGYAAIAGVFLFLGGHGVLAWGEQKIPSGPAALLCATLPLWTVLLSRIDGTEGKLGIRAWAGLFLGFTGVAVLIGPSVLRQRLDLLAAGAVLSSALLWAMGTSYTRAVRMPASTVLSAAMQMVSGGTMLLIAGLLTGEAAQVHVASITMRSVLSLAYLIVFGSIIAFTVYVWLLTVSSPSRISTYAYVNPVVAVFLGWILAGEALGVRTLAATGTILVGVALVSTRRKQTVTLEVRCSSIPAEEACETAGD